MNIGYFGDGRWARLALDRIHEDPELEVVYVVARHDAPDPGLRDRANTLDIPFFAPENVNAPSFLEEIGAFVPDINVSMSYDQILQTDAIEAAPKGFINCHAGALPFYRGRNVLNWALINGEDRFGVTVHCVEEGIDSGDILTQRFGVITPQDDYQSLLDKAVELCTEVLLDALHDVRRGEVTVTPQEDIHPAGFYSSARGEGDEWIDWSWPTERIYNLIRAISPPGPGARTLLDGRPVVVTEAERIPNSPEYIDRPGTVVGKSSDGIVVKTGDTTLKVTKIADWEGEIVDPRVPKHRIGTVFGQNLKTKVKRLSDRVSELEQRISTLEE
ncbi:methionyl-tRNA formyltransferase [Salinibacter pepae]|jgi:methionyl-tRNA formyltransferase|uniref:methionyl-tRNA formyltransferase n=1 Tax=Salinibacter pepae TaxID=3040382 RepID=UPI0021E89C2D|nr:methionyl-tRNA formyltransferase [Salinibacter pepae]